jgi:hypothetical protein
VLAVLAVRAGAQGVPGAPEAPRVDAALLRLGADSMQIYIVKGDKRDRLGTVRDELHADGEARLRRVVRATNVLFGASLDTAYFRLPGLQPLGHRSYAAGGSERLDFARDSVVGVVTLPGDAPKRMAWAADPALYDPSGLDLLLRAAPLAPGFAHRVRLVIATMDTVVEASARVTGSDPVAVEGGRLVDTWVVEVDHGGARSTVWIEKRTRRLARRVVPFAPGSHLLMTRDDGPPPRPPGT